MRTIILLRIIFAVSFVFWILAVTYEWTPVVVGAIFAIGSVWCLVICLMWSDDDIPSRKP